MTNYCAGELYSQSAIVDSGYGNSNNAALLELLIVLTLIEKSITILNPRLTDHAVDHHTLNFVAVAVAMSRTDRQMTVLLLILVPHQIMFRKPHTQM